jgi:hypothetical protein
MSVILATQEAEIRKIMVQGHLGQKVSKNPYQPVKLCVVAPACDLSYVGSRTRRITVQASLVEKVRLYPPNN